MFSRKNLYRLLLLGLLLAILAVPIFAIATDAAGVTSGSAYSTGITLENTDGPTAIADNQCNGGSGGGCGGG